MIGKSIAVFFLLLAVHALFVYVRPRPMVQHQWQENLIKAEGYMYSTNVPSSVMVGSSLSATPKVELLPDTYSLAFKGQSVFDGLYLLSREHFFPKNVLIEMNMVTRPQDKRFTDLLYSPMLHASKQTMPSLREAYQPMGILNRLYFSMERHLTSLHPTYDSHGSTNTEGKLFDALLAEQIKSNSLPIDQSDLTRQFDLLRYYVELLEHKGVRIIFYEMPMNEKLHHLLRPEEIRETFYKYFSPSAYKYFVLSDWSSFSTADGVHLKPDEALRYTNLLKLAMQNRGIW